MKCPGYVGYGIRNDRENCGGGALNSLKTGFICLFSGSVFFSTLRNTDWMDIHNMDIK